MYEDFIHRKYEEERAVRESLESEIMAAHGVLNRAGVPMLDNLADRVAWAIRRQNQLENDPARYDEPLL